MLRPPHPRATLVVSLVALALQVGAVRHVAAGRGLAALRLDPASLPLGDGRTTRVPTRGAVMTCGTGFPGGGGAHRIGEWIRNGRWYPAEKPTVEGAVRWPGAAITVGIAATADGPRRVVRTNALPTHVTGEFPIRPGTRAFAYDRNPNAIREQAVVAALPLDPDTTVAPSCVPMGPVGIAVTGTAIFNAFDLAGRDAPAYEIQDRCDGHPEIRGSYHYHNWSRCIPDPEGDAGRHSSLAGWMLDGIPIFGPRGEGGRVLANADLDACHGHAHAVTIDGVTRTRYHYHFTHEYPYTLGCFRATPSARRAGT